MKLIEKITENIDSMSLIEIEAFVENNREELLELMGEYLDGYSSSEKREMLSTLIEV